MAVTYSGNAATTRSNLGLGSLATLSSVGASQITDNSVGAAELNVSGNGTSGQVLKSDGDGTFTWGDVDASVDYSGGASSSGTTSTPPVGALFACALWNNINNTNTTYTWFAGGYGDTEAASSYKQLILRYYGRWVGGDPSYHSIYSAITINSGTYQYLGSGAKQSTFTEYAHEGTALVVRTA